MSRDRRDATHRLAFLAPTAGDEFLHVHAKRLGGPSFSVRASDSGWMWCHRARLRLRHYARMSGIDDEVTEGQRTALQVIYDLLRDLGKWPPFAVVDHELDRVGLAAEEVLPQLRS